MRNELVALPANLNTIFGKEALIENIFHLGLRSLLCAIVVSASIGCASFYTNSISQSRLDHGLTIVLPGIEGNSLANGNIARGLESSEVATAIQIHDWTTGFAPLFLVHLRDGRRHRREAEELADQIVDYQLIYPDRPVYLVGHSGGGAMALLTLESLPADHQVTAVFLLAPAISPKYPIQQVLPKTELGIWNYYSALDFPLLIAGTTVAQTVDGRNSPSAGALGFRYDDSEPVKSQSPRLKQVPYDPSMIALRHAGGHFGWTDPAFIRIHIAPVIIDHEATQTRRVRREIR
jgi:pimeloyl-ACP methyl ester carboxylesterase